MYSPLPFLVEMFENYYDVVNESQEKEQKTGNGCEGRIEKWSISVSVQLN